MKPSDYIKIKSHITIEEAEELGLLQICIQLERDRTTRKAMGLEPLQKAIHDPIWSGRGRPKKT